MILAALMLAIAPVAAKPSKPAMGRC